MSGAAPLVLVVVGTDHHPFDRVVRWAEAWLRDRTGGMGAPQRVRVVVQHGAAAPPTLAEGAPLLPHDRLQRLMAQAAAVVSHGGPATITEVRRAGRLPVVVPRDPALGEHVDAHQQLFSRRMGGAGLVRLCESEAALREALDAALADPSAFRVDAGGEARRVAAAVDRVAAVVDQVVAGSPGRRRLWGRGRRRR